MQKHHRRLAFALALCLCAALLPAQALASGEPAEPVIEAAEAVTTETVEQIEEAGTPDEAAAPESEEPPAEPEPAPPAEEAVAAAEAAAPYALDGASNEQEIYSYLVGTMGLNTAAACGILANIEKESSFNPTAGGDGGTSYGICQWHASRYTALKNYCAENGYDYTTLEGQLHYLEYELTGTYKSILNAIRAVPNTAQGAYDAASTWCIRFEVPANKEAVAVVRGNLARDTYWPKYANVSLCTVTLDADGGVPVESLTVSCGSAIGPLPTTTRGGYTFGGWYTERNGGGVRLNRDTVILADTTYYARWDANLYTVRFDAGEGRADVTTKNVFWGETFGTLPVPTRTGYEFAGWYTEEDGGGLQIMEFTLVGNDTLLSDVLYAYWVKTEPRSFTVRYDANGGTGVPFQDTKREGIDLVLPATRPQRRGYTFLGWATSASAAEAEYKPGGVFTLDADTTLYAVWQANFVSGDADGDGLVTPADAARTLGPGAAGAAADLDGDGVVDSYDAARMLCLAVGRAG